MDVSVLSDEELDALQLAVNTEIGVRLQRKRMERRLAAVFADADANGVPFTEIDSVLIDAKAKAVADKAEANERDAPVVDAKVPESTSVRP